MKELTKFIRRETKERRERISIFDALMTKFKPIELTFQGRLLPKRAAFPVIFMPTAIFNNTREMLGRSFVVAAEPFVVDDEVPGGGLAEIFNWSNADIIKNTFESDPSILPFSIFHGSSKNILWMMHPRLVIGIRDGVPNGYKTAYLTVDPAGRLSVNSLHFPGGDYVPEDALQWKIWKGNPPIFVQPCGNYRFYGDDNGMGAVVPVIFKAKDRKNWDRLAIDTILQLTPDFSR